jgi:hypothetical protein
MSDLDFYQTQVDECRRLLGTTDDLLAREVHEAMLQECQDRLVKAAARDVELRATPTKPGEP